MFKRFSACTLAVSLLAVSLSACGTQALDASALSSRLRAQSSSNTFLDDVFAILDDDGTATSEQSAERAAARAARIEALKTSNPELVAELEALQSLDVEARAERLQAIREAYPELFHGGKGPGGRGHAGPPGGKMGRPGFGMGMPGQVPPTLASSNPELAAALEALQDLTPEERKAKIDALREEHPDWFPGPMMAPPAGGPGRGGGHHKGFFPGPMASPNPELAAALAELKDLTPEERKAKIDALREEHPDWFPVRPTPPQPTAS
ncbi:MAG: hypothetical protein ACO1RX_01640 [Candidatus Sericytochromatia bacterium]